LSITVKGRLLWCGYVKRECIRRFGIPNKRWVKHPLGGLQTKKKRFKFFVVVEFAA
jgi:hypothetical protein